MIGWLNGKILYKKPPHILININGVGYEIEASMNTFYQLPEKDDEVSLYTHLIIREDAHLLYGFIDTSEKELFKILIKTSGIGPRTALAILSSMNPNQLVSCVKNADHQKLITIPGIGKKTAERLVIEIRDKLNDWQQAPVSEDSYRPSSENTHQEDAISALIALGYKNNQAEKVVKSINDKELSSESLIKESLKILAV